MPTLLAISHASINRPHRRAFEVLAERLGWSVHIAAPRELPFGTNSTKQCEPAPQGASYALHPLAVSRPDSARLTSFRGLARLARRTRPDVVFVEYDPGSVSIIEAYALTRPWRSRIVAYTVENFATQRLQKARTALRRGDFRAASRDAGVGTLHALGRRSIDALACLNADGLRIYRDLWGWTMPARVVPLGTDLDLFRPAREPALRTSLGFGVGHFVVGYFGRLIREKCVHMLVEALPSLPNNVRLLLDMFTNFVPGDYAHGLLARAVELGVRDRIVTIDVPHGEVPRYMNCCDAIALVSTENARFKEQFGRVLPEAMACGVPVICTASGNLPDIVGDAGLVIERDSVDALVDAIRQLSLDPARRSILATAGLARVRSHWSVDVQAAKLDALFRTVL